MPNVSRNTTLSNAPSAPNPTASPSTKPQPATATPPPRVAFISGHIEITPGQFSANYAGALDAAIRRGDAFAPSNAGGVDTLALAYLRTHRVSPSRITIYLHRPRPNRKLNATQDRINKMRLGPEVEEKYRKQGYNIRVIQGYHTERDAAMTEASDYDILWVRGDAETAALYGSKYRPGRISGTQKNRDRRLLKDKRTGTPSVT
ncbi:hypothetical protein BU26DRAFT_571519 [Trematosphaeria pertusa]|uniref:Uncharacterized protein n=1 Tax=Trematosphaeria pertusa TaxID=390896 RepID=A0A6A6HWK3_9PLEO|nr:uncharacterized protein BU26DRAFT_571519 [Trematosphaeria pertusa]KAF2241770.1 hypothetical protein BU26DRAFT_571519 [Trematosphaeria pertusa]